MSDGILSFLTQGAAPVPAPTGSDTSTAFPLWLQTALYDVTGAGFNLANQPYNPFPGPMVASPSSQTQQAWNLAGQNVGNWQPFLGAAGGLYNNASTGALNAAQMAQQGAGQWQPYLGTAAGLTAGSAGGALDAANLAQNNIGVAQPYINSATSLVGPGSQGLTPGAINAVINPFQNYVTQGLDYNLTNNIMPAISDRFVSSGQVASPQMAQMTNQAIRDTQQAAGQSMAGAYQGALNSVLGSEQQQLAGAGQYGALGQLALGAGTQGVNSLLAAAQGLGAAGTQYGALGQLSSSLTGQDISQNLAPVTSMQNLGTQYGALGTLASTLGAQDVGQLGAAGAAQDTFAQQNLNAAQNQFQQQTQWPYQNLSYLQSILEGLPMQAAGSTSQTVGSTYNYPATSSPLSSGLGTLLTAKALGLKKGGRAVKRGGTGALSLYRKAA